MKNSAWDKLAENLEKARIEGYSSFVWSIQFDDFFRVSIEWNGGLPFISYRNLQDGTENFDVTAKQMLNLMESVE